MFTGKVKNITRFTITIMMVGALLLPLFSFPALPAAEGASVVPVVSAGSAHSLAVRSDGSVWSWGYNGHGQLGDGTRVDKTKPVQLKELEGVRAVSAGGGFSLALKQDGTVWAWGRNNVGQLGIGATYDRIRPVQVSGLRNIIAISAGYTHALALRNDGTVWAWGHNEYGQLGDGTAFTRTAPVQVEGLDGIRAISAGNAYSLAVRYDGTVWAWGINDWGQLGDNTTENKSTPVRVPLLTDVNMVSAGRFHSMALKNDGTVWAWGRNHHGQLGLGTRTGKIVPEEVTELSSVAAIGVGEEYSMAVKLNGTVWTWGSNEYGQLGDGTTGTRTRPVHVKTLTGVSSISAGSGYALVTTADSSIWGWGYNGSGGLGDGTTTNRSVPVEVAFTCTVSVRSRPSVGGEATGGGEFEHGSRITVRAAVNDGYIFVNWTEEGEEVSTDARYTFTLADDRILQANFIGVLDLLEKRLKDDYRGLKKEFTYQNTISEDEQSDRIYYTATAGNDLVFMLGWSAERTELELSVYNPAGTLHRRVKKDEMPVVIEAKNVTGGSWSFEVGGEKVFGDDRYYLVLVGEGKLTSNPGSNPVRTLGDVSGSGSINVNDAVLVMRHVLGLESLKTEQADYADVNGDDRVDVKDTSLIMQKTLGLIDEFPSN